jgi:hypothetical protein
MGLVKKMIDDWAIQCLEEKALPVVLIAMKGPREAIVLKGNDHTNFHMKVFLHAIANDIPDNNEVFEDFYFIIR